MTIVFCHIGWMKRYQGQTPNDQLIGGGRYVEVQGSGHEVCNFSPVRGQQYGYVQVGKGRGDRFQEASFNLRRLGATRGQDEVHDVTVVWTATDRNERCRKVVGWYKQATIFRRFQVFEKLTRLQEENQITGFWISAPADQCVLLSEAERRLVVPTMTPGFPGISPIWYADSPESEEFVREARAHIAAVGQGLNQQLAQLRHGLAQANYFSDSDTDERTRVLREIVQRRGQERFRRDLLSAYGNRCAVTGCDAVDALEAAHLIGYKGPQTQHVSNGLLLRADIHTLFDLGLLSICPNTLKVVLTSALQQSSYAPLHGQALRLPSDPMMRPDRGALARRWLSNRVET